MPHTSENEAKTVTIESHENPVMVFEDLVKKHRAERRDAKASESEWLEKRSAALPERARADVRAYEKKLLELNPGPEAAALRAELAEGLIIKFEQVYQDRRFTVGNGEHMLNRNYAKEQAIGWLKTMLDGEPTPGDLKKVALINFDANGLKSINDLAASHEHGTEYLKRLAEVFHDPASKTARWLKTQGITDILAVTAGGDEYSVIIRSEDPIEKDVIAEAIVRYDKAIADISVSDLLNFQDFEVQLRYLGLSKKAYDQMTDAEQRSTQKTLAKEIPPGFLMRSSASGGGATLYEGFLSALRHASKPLKVEEDTYGQKLGKIMGGMWDAADQEAIQEKNTYKERLGKSNNPQERFYRKVLMRTTEVRIIEANLERKTWELRLRREFEQDVESMDQLLYDGLMSPDKHRSLKQDKKEEMERMLGGELAA